MSNDTTDERSVSTHRIYSVMKNGDDKPTWTEIGAAWAHNGWQRLRTEVRCPSSSKGAELVLRVV